MWQSLYVHIPARHPSSVELEVPTILQVHCCSCSQDHLLKFNERNLICTCIFSIRTKLTMIFWLWFNASFCFDSPVSSTNVSRTSLWRISTPTDYANPFGILFSQFACWLTQCSMYIFLFCLCGQSNSIVHYNGDCACIHKWKIWTNP